MRKASALAINIGAARGLQDVVKSNLGPRGTMKMLVSGAGMIKITKDGNTILGEMQIQHPTASLIARAATATDDESGDGSTSTVIVIGEMMRQCERYIQEGLHPRLLTEGFELAKGEASRFLHSGVPTVPVVEGPGLRDLVNQVTRTALSTKVGPAMKDALAAAIVDAVFAIRQPNAPIDLHMVEIMHMKHRLGTETSFINGIVLDHGGRHDGMPQRVENCYILICNISLEWEKSELTSGFYYSSAEQKQQMADAERKVTDDRTRAIIEMKRQLCTKENGKNFVIVNQKGIDGLALEMLAREGILALRRAKRRNMERLALSCGGECINSTEGMTPECLGYAGLVHEYTLGDEKYTFVEQASKGKSCTLLIRGQNDHTIAQIKDAVRDGLRAVKNTLEDGKVVPGAGYFEVACSQHLHKYADTVTGKQKIGVRAFADSLLVIPKTLAENSGHDVQAAIIALQEAVSRCAPGTFAGLDIVTGEALNPVSAGIYDNFVVKKSLVDTTGVIASQLLLVDEIMKAGRRGAGAAPQE